MIILQKRKDIPTYLTIAVPIIAILITVLAGGIIFALLGYPPLAALYEFFIAPLSRP